MEATDGAVNWEILPSPQPQVVRCPDCGKVIEHPEWDGNDLILDHDCPAHRSDIALDAAMEQFKSDNDAAYNVWYTGLRDDLARDLGILLRQHRTPTLRGHSLVISLRLNADTLERLDEMAEQRKSNRSEVVRDIIDGAIWHE